MRIHQYGMELERRQYDMKLERQQYGMKLERQRKLGTVVKSKDGHKFNKTENQGEHHQPSIMKMPEHQRKFGMAKMLE